MGSGRTGWIPGPPACPDASDAARGWRHTFSKFQNSCFFFKQSYVWTFLYNFETIIFALFVIFSANNFDINSGPIPDGSPNNMATFIFFCVILLSLLYFF